VKPTDPIYCNEINIKQDTTMSQSINQKIQTRRRRVAIVLCGAAASLMLLVAGSTGEEAAPATQPAANQPAGERSRNDLIASGVNANGKLELMLNKTAVISTRAPYKRVSVGQPEIADVNPISPTNLLVTAKKAGTTQLIIWDDAERSQVIDVAVVHDLAQLEDQLKAMFPDTKVTVEGANGSVVLRGRVPKLAVAEQMAQLAKPYALEGAEVLNFLEISGGQQVMLMVKFAEVSRSVQNSLGVNLGFTDGGTILGTVNGGAPAFNLATAGASNALGVPQTTTGSQLFGSVDLGGSTIVGFLNALRQNNLMRLLAEPNLIAASGEEASFLAGGEFPVPVPQSSSGGGTTITIEYREFGVRLNFTPVVLGNGRIRLKATPEVSDLDFSSPVVNAGFRIPIINKRRVQTTVELNEGQTFAIAGLLNNQVTASKDVTPLLGDLPIIGTLFRSVRFERKETELVVLVTPMLVEGMGPGEVPTLPGQNWRYPNEGELFWNRDLGGPKEALPENTTPPKFQGAYGFQPVAPLAGVDSGSAE